MVSYRALPARAQRYLTFVLAAAVAFTAASIWLSGLLGRIPSPGTVLEIVYLLAATQVAALLPLRWSRGTQNVIAPPLVALGLVAPGLGPVIACWLFTYDGRRPGATISWPTLFFNRANLALSYGIPSLLVAHLTLPPLVDVPVKTLLIAFANVTINYSLTAGWFGRITDRPALELLLENVGFGALRSLIILCFAGGILFDLLAQPVGYILSLGLFGFVYSVRSNMADAQRQALARVQTLELAAQALDARDRYTESHSIRVADLAIKIGEHLDLTQREIEELRMAGTLHDLGKIGVRDDILNKAGPLTPDEWDEMRRHPDIGADMIEKHSALAAVSPMVRHHHERWDGTGYPSGRHGMDIPLGARILAVADSFDTITADRIYRRSHMTVEEGVQDISARAGRWYDPAVVDAFRAVFELEPIAQAGPLGLAERRVPLAALLRQPRFLRLMLSAAVSGLGDPLTLTAAMATLYSGSRQPIVLAVAFCAQALAAIAVGTLGAALPDRLQRHRLIPALEGARAVLLCLTPFLLSISLYAVIPILFLLAAAEGVVQPARQAAVAEVVERRALSTANAAMAGMGRFTWAIGAAIAFCVLFLTRGSVNVLFVADGVTFALAGALLLGIGSIGGGVQVRLLRGVSGAWSVRAVRPHLLVAAAATFALSMSMPALVVLAYDRAPSFVDGGAYGILQFALGLGIAFGALLIARAGLPQRMWSVALGLTVMGLGSIGMGVVDWLWLTALLLFLASAGNSIYFVGNQTALMELGQSGNRGSIMSLRFGISQTMLMLGASLGGFVVSRLGAGGTYIVLGGALVAVAIVAAVLAARGVGADQELADVPASLTATVTEQPIGAAHPSA